MGSYKSFSRNHRGQEEDAKERTYTIQEAVEEIGLGWMQIKMAITLGIAWMADSMEVMIMSILGPILMCEWQLVPSQQALLSTIVFVGLILGCTVHGKMADVFGRKTALILTTAWSMYFGILSGTAPDFGWLLMLRALSGFGIAGLFVCPVYISEFLPIRYRAKMVILQTSCWSLGAIVVAVLGLALLDIIGWRWWMILCATPLGVFLLLCSTLPESPRYLLAAGRKAEAMDILRKIAKTNGSSMPEGKLVSQKEITETGRLSDVFINGRWKLTLLLTMLYFLTLFCFYGIILLTTQLVSMDIWCLRGEGVKGSTGESTCPLECKTLGRKQYIDILWTTFAEVPGILMNLVLLDTIGRRWLFRLCFSIFAICCGLLFLCVSHGFIITILFIARMVIGAALQAFYVYAPEVYPTEVRGLAMGVISTVGRVGSAITPYVAVVLVRQSMYLGVGTYMVASLLALVISFLLPYETKDKALDEVE